MIRIEGKNEGEPRALLRLLIEASGLAEAAARQVIEMGGAYVGKPRCKEPDRLLHRGECFSAYYEWPLRLETVAFDSAWILYEGGGLLIAAKPVGLPTQGRRDGDLTAFYEILKSGLPGYLGLHHRLDQDTSGLMLFTRDPSLNKEVAKLFQENQLEKRYLAITRSFWPFEGEEGLVDAAIGPERGDRGTRQIVTTAGKPARTRLRLRADCAGWQLIEAQPLTGRTHQIRVHLAHVGLPLWGDALYGGGRGGFRLHCHRLAWEKQAKLATARFELPPPESFWLDAPPSLRQAFESGLRQEHEWVMESEQPRPC